MKTMNSSIFYELLFKDLFKIESEFSPINRVKLNYPVDIYQNKKGLFIEIAATGISKDDINIDVDGRVLNVEYKKPTSDEECCDVDDCKYFVRNIAKRSFGFSYKISDGLDLDKIEAKMDNGLLTIHIPKNVKENKSLKVAIQ